LRKIDQSTLDFIFNNLSRNEQLDYLAIETGQLKLMEDRYRKGMSTFNKSFLYFHIIRKDTAKSIGWCGYHTWYIDHNRAEIGYVLDSKDDMNQGFMTEALSEILKYGFEQMNLNRIEAFLAKTNTPSLKLVERFGFSEEGLLREHYFKNGRVENSSIYSLLQSEFR
jgi:ribosomal-protein-alanine N-acetyltransferase